MCLFVCFCCCVTVFQNQPLTYEVSYSSRGSERSRLIHRGLNNTVIFKLPAGDPANNYSGITRMSLLCYTLYACILPSRMAHLNECRHRFHCGFYYCWIFATARFRATTIFSLVFDTTFVPFSALTQLVWCQEGHLGPAKIHATYCQRIQVKFSLGKRP